MSDAADHLCQGPGLIYVLLNQSRKGPRAVSLQRHPYLERLETACQLYAAVSERQPAGNDSTAGLCEIARRLRKGVAMRLCIAHDRARDLEWKVHPLMKIKPRVASSPLQQAAQSSDSRASAPNAPLRETTNLRRGRLRRELQGRRSLPCLPSPRWR